MNVFSTQLTYFLNERETRRNIGALLKFFAFLVGIIIGIILPAIVQSELNKYAGEVEVAAA